jgi:hypothetical protein
MILSHTVIAVVAVVAGQSHVRAQTPAALHLNDTAGK